MRIGAGDPDVLVLLLEIAADAGERAAAADQWNNLDNAKAHYELTGPEIWEQTGGKVDGFVCSVGSGGTLAGISRF